MIDNYIALKPVKFDRHYIVGENIPKEVIEPNMIEKLIKSGVIQIQQDNELKNLKKNFEQQEKKLEECQEKVKELEEKLKKIQAENKNVESMVNVKKK